MRKEIITNIQTHNRFLHDEYLSRFSDYELLKFCHPFDREIFKLQLDHEQSVSNQRKEEKN